MILSVTADLAIYAWLYADLLGGTLTGISPMINAITVNDSLPYTPLYLLPRNEDQSQPKPRRNWREPLKVPKQFWLIHSSNAYEEQCADERTRIVFDGTACSYNWFNLGKMFGGFHISIVLC